MSFSGSPDHSNFSRERHVRYWLRCLKTYLPNLYTSNDSNRMTLGFFILSALDILGVLHDHTTPLERSEYIEWIYLCQHPDGGFRGFTGTNFGDGLRGSENKQWDPANVAGTFFALAGLAVLGDSMERVKRKECLEWLIRLQWEDGSFGEVLGKDGKIQGKRDLRQCYLAAVTRWILRDHQDLQNVRDINIDKLVSFVMSSKTYDGGIGQAPFHEAHAGWTYCGIGTLSLLDRLPPMDSKSASPRFTAAADEAFVQDILHWLVHRQTTTLLDDQEGFEITDEGPLSVQAAPIGVYQDTPSTQEFQSDGLRVVASQHESDPSLAQNIGALTGLPPSMPLDADPEKLLWIGFSGRCNKFADTCYSFWAGGTLGILKKVHLLSYHSIRKYLLEKTQHMIGGFGKMPGDPPDILHSYLGLAALAVIKEPGLRSIDATLCISVSAREHLEGLPWRHGDYIV
ncbi:hypothetical protein MMC13_003333 [Lambiella insularis]|nr:hypothetical protein [Lambiella insularis]